MTAHRIFLLALCGLSLYPLGLHAQNAPASSSSASPMDMSNMPGMSPPMPAASSNATNAPNLPAHQNSMAGMEMGDDAAFGMLLVDQLETVHTRDGNGQAWEAESWYGYDENKLWLRSEGSRSDGRVDEGDIEALWSHAISAFWNTQLGVRQSIGLGPSQTWSALGVQGTAPYNVELEATAYLRTDGQSAARLRGEYELRLTQRLILQPEAELNMYSSNSHVQRLGGDISTVQFGLRLRYTFGRQFAPYLGVNGVRRLSSVAVALPSLRQPLIDRQIVAGLHFWF